MQNSCNLESLTTSYEYVNGALCRIVFEDVPWGKGKGTFHWPSGMVYEGEFMGLQRHGKGRQQWPDDSVYEGDFVNDLRQGRGRHWWYNGETYEGDYWQDKRHGSGTYSWPSGSKFKGSFFQDVKEGYGVFTAASGEKFKGHYHHDVRCGDGVIYYSRCQQDVGVWQGAHLVQLKFSVPDASFDPLQAIKGNLRSLDTPNYHQLRGVPGGKGPLEVASEELIQAARLGQQSRVLSMLQVGAVYPDVMDANRHTPLFAAATHGRVEILDLLLDYGADINRLDSADVSPLTACLHLLYASSPKVLVLLKKKYCLPEEGHSQLGSVASEYSLYTTDLDLSLTHSEDPPNTDEEEEQRDVIATSQLAGEGSAEREFESEHSTATSGGMATDISPGPLAQLQDGHNQEIAERDHDKQEQRDTMAITPASMEGLDKPATPTDRETPKSWTGVHESSGALTSLQCTGDYDIQGDPPVTNSPNQPYPEKSSVEGTIPGVLLHTKESPEGVINEQNFSGSKTHLPSRAVLDENRLNTNNNTAEPGAAHQQMLSLEAENTEDQKLLPFNSHTHGHQAHEGSSPHTSPEILPSLTKDDGRLQCLTPLSGTLSSNSEDAADDLDEDVADNLETSLTKAHGILEASPHPRDQFDTLRQGLHSCPPIVLLEEESMVSLTTPCLSQAPSRCKNPRGLAYPSSQFGPVLSAAESISFSCTSVSTGLPSSIGSEKQELPGSLLRDTVLLLLQRGADPNLSQQPLPALYYAILAEDKDLVIQILDKGASLSSHLSLQLGGLLPLHVAVSLGSITGVEITKILLERGADLETFTASETISLEEGEEVDNGKDAYFARERWTPIHLACATGRELDRDAVQKMIRLLVREGASVNEVTSSHSPLSLAIMHGHDQVVDYLLTVGADPNLSLGPLVANALCSTTTHSAHRNRELTTSVKLVQKLLIEGAQLLQMVTLANCNQKGTVVDFAYDAFNQDRRLSQLRYVALTRAERVRYKSARRLIRYFLCLLRIKAVENVPGLEKQVTDQLLDSSPKKLISGTSASATPRLCPGSAQGKRQGASLRNKQTLPLIPIFTIRASLIYVAHLHGLTNRHLGRREEGAAISDYLRSVLSLLAPSTTPPHWSLHSFCYECGRSVRVRLTRCSGCRMVSYCSQACKDNSWRVGHRMECSGAPAQAKVIPSQKKRVKQRRAKTKAVNQLTPSLSISDDPAHPHPSSPPSRTHHAVSNYHQNITRIAVRNVKEAVSHYQHLQEIIDEPSPE